MGFFKRRKLSLSCTHGISYALSLDIISPNNERGKILNNVLYTFYVDFVNLTHFKIYLASRGNAEVDTLFFIFIFLWIFCTMLACFRGKALGWIAFPWSYYIDIYSLYLSINIICNRSHGPYLNCIYYTSAYMESDVNFNENCSNTGSPWIERNVRLIKTLNYILRILLSTTTAADFIKIGVGLLTMAKIQNRYYKIKLPLRGPLWPALVKLDDVIPRNTL